MAVAMLQTAEMFTKEMYDQLNEKMFGHKGIRPEEAPEGLILHSAGQGDRGWYVYDIWESREAFQRFMDEKLMPEHVPFTTWFPVVSTPDPPHDTGTFIVPWLGLRWMVTD